MKARFLGSSDIVSVSPSAFVTLKLNAVTFPDPSTDTLLFVFFSAVKDPSTANSLDL